MITNKRNKNLGKLVGGHTLQGGKVFKTHLQINKNHATQRIYHFYFCYTQVVKLLKAIKPTECLKCSTN